MGFLSNLFGGNKADSVANDEDNLFLQAEPISRKRMDLLWLDPPRLSPLIGPLKEHNSISITLGDKTELREHEITLDDYQYAKQVETIVDKAFNAAERKDYKEAIKWYKEALKIAPGCDLFLMSIGVGYTQLGNKKRGISYLERAASISPGNTRIKDNLKNARS